MKRNRTWVLPVSVALALLLGLVPLPALLQPLRPYWLALVLTYWVIETPDRTGPGWASPSASACWPTCSMAASSASRRCGWW